jgi:tryptophan synthase
MRKCLISRMSFVPLISPATSIDRVKFLASIADSFIYVVSKMGVTGSNANTNVSASLPELIKRIQQFTPVPLAVGFGIDNRTHFDFVTSAGADGVVIGSRIVNIILQNPNSAPKAVEEYCLTISLKGKAPKLGRLGLNGNGSEVNGNKVTPDDVPAPLPIPADSAPQNKEELEVKSGGKLPSRFGIFGGAYVPESLIDCLNELESAYVDAKNDPSFWKEFESMYGYMNRPSELYLAERLTEAMGGASIWLK